MLDVTGAPDSGVNAQCTDEFQDRLFLRKLRGRKNRCFDADCNYRFRKNYPNEVPIRISLGQNYPKNETQPFPLNEGDPNFLGSSECRC